MSAETFIVQVEGRGPKDAFERAVRRAQYSFGHSGYTGTIAEKVNFVMVEVPDGKDPEDYANERLGDRTCALNDKWGPAGCISLGPEKRGSRVRDYLFFGWASA